MTVHLYRMDSITGKICMSILPDIESAMNKMDILQKKKVTYWFRINEDTKCPCCGSSQFVYNSLLDSMVCSSCGAEVYSEVNE